MKSIKQKNFRDFINTIDSKGLRKWIYPQKINGYYYKRRKYLSWFLISIFVICPFIKINKNPFFKFDIIKNEFFIFSTPIYNQDFFIIALIIIIILIFIFIITIFYGRVFCGWICPQTIFLEMVFRKIEYIIEGNRNSQIKLNKQNWNLNKFKKKILKWMLFILISFIMSILSISYIIGIDIIFNIITNGFKNNYILISIIIINTGVIYFVYVWFREQACTLVCPYGRLQSVLINKKTITVNYDYLRKDCINCNQCVVVCPTGIDIRNGIQLECINCSLCIDACNNVMKKIKSPQGLIRYDSQFNIENKYKIKLNYIYNSLFLIFPIVILIIFFCFRKSIDIKILRIPGYEYFINNNNIINIYEYTITNKTFYKKQLNIKILSHVGKIFFPYNNNNNIEIEKNKIVKGIIYLSIPKHKINKSKTRITIDVYNKNKHYIYKTNFLGPFNF